MFCKPTRGFKFLCSKFQFLDFFSFLLSPLLCTLGYRTLHSTSCMCIWLLCNKQEYGVSQFHYLPYSIWGHLVIMCALAKSMGTGVRCAMMPPCCVWECFLHLVCGYTHVGGLPDIVWLEWVTEWLCWTYTCCSITGGALISRALTLCVYSESLSIFLLVFC